MKWAPKSSIKRNFPAFALAASPSQLRDRGLLLRLYSKQATKPTGHTNDSVTDIGEFERENRYG